jgi:hypothetical protein
MRSAPPIAKTTLRLGFAKAPIDNFADDRALE